MIEEQNQTVFSVQSQSSQNFSQFQIGQRIKKITTHQLYQIRQNQQIYIAKIFKNQFRTNFQNQVRILSKLKHPHIIKMIFYKTSSNQEISLWNCDMIIFEDAKHGDLNDYIPLNGKLQEPVAKVIFKQIIQALNYASKIQPQGIIHPNLTPSSILLDEKRQVKICGWSKLPQLKTKQEIIKNTLFCTAQILICLLTSYMPFYNKNSVVDPLFKFLKPQYINKFWIHLSNRVTAKDKSFKFSSSVKQLIQDIFFNKIITFEGVLQSDWLKDQTLTTEQVNSIMEKQEIRSLQKRNSALRQQQMTAQRKKKILQQYEEESKKNSLYRVSNQHQFFVNDFYDNFSQDKNIPIATECSQLIKLYDDRPSFVIASFKQNLNRIKQSGQSLIFGDQFKLQSYYVQKKNNEALVEIKFESFNSEQQTQQKEQSNNVNVEEMLIVSRCVIRFYKNNQNQLYAQIRILQSDLNEFYSTMIMKFIEDSIKLIRDKQ